MTNDEISFNVKKVRGLFKESYTLGFFLFCIITLLLVLIKSLNLFTGVAFFAKISSTISTGFLLFLAAAFGLSAILAYFKKPKLMFLPIILWLLIFTASVRTANISGLKDITTGEWTLGPDLDPFLYLRHAKEIAAGTLENPDMFRQSPLGVESYASQNIMPWAIFYVHKILNIFGDSSVTYAAIIAPVIFFILSLLGFMLFVKNLSSTKFSNEQSWIIAVISGFFYTTIPHMLHRTVAGIPEIESLGMVFFWFAFLFFVLAWKSDSKRKQLLMGGLVGIFTGLMSWTWGGYRYIYMILAVTALILLLVNKEKSKNVNIFTSFAIVGLLIELAKSGSIKSVIMSVGDTGFAIFVLLVMTIDFLLPKISQKVHLLKKINMPDSFKSLIFGIALVLIFLAIIDIQSLINLASSIFERILYPFGRERIGQTVAENRTSYFLDIIQSFGSLTWVFIFGTILIFYEATKKFSKKNKIYLNLTFVLLVLGFIFSRYSSTSILNGDNFISQILAFGSLGVFFFTFAIIYIKAHQKHDEKTLEDFRDIGFEVILLLSISFLTIVSLRGAIRLFFIISPMIIIISAITLIYLTSYKKEKSEWDAKRIFLSITAFVVILIMASSFATYVQASSYEAKMTVPSTYNFQWQKAMDWVRNETPIGSTFVHWWDYGFWVQTLGERPTVTDGAHANTFWDHTTARYLLTTPNPDSALSLMKSYNVSYLLIDSTDLGKYSAYSKIGSGVSGEDRFDAIPILVLDSKQTQEKANSTLRVYSGGFVINEDLIYDVNGTQKILPKNNAALIGIILEFSKNSSQIQQPLGVFYYNGNQIYLPIRKIFMNGELLDFGEGVDSTLRVIPLLSNVQNQAVIDNTGALIYLSEKTSSSLFAQLYLMDDPEDKYSTVSLAHTEKDPLIENLESQGVSIGDFVYYQGFRGPIKIWNIDYPEEIITVKEFLKTDKDPWEWGELDDYKFTK